MPLGAGAAAVSSTTLTQTLRFALRQLGAQNGQYEFENLCRHLARVTIAKNILPATGPVGSGGDRGRDFETYPTKLPDQVRPEGANRGISDGDAISFACTLQQRGIRSKVLDDVEKTTSQGPPVDWVVAYCEVDIPIAKRADLEREASQRHDVRVVVFDGTAIAELLSVRADELASAIESYLHVDVGRRQPTRPRGLPLRPARWVNRDEEIGRLDAIRARAKRASATEVIVLQGTPGVGKSAFGSEWVHRNEASFTGGALYGDFSRVENDVPVAASEVSAGFLQQLGLRADAIPSSFADRRRLYQWLTSDRDFVVFLDDVEHPAQASALIPAGPGSVVVVTSKWPLDELVADGAEHRRVDPLAPASSRELLERFTGSGRLQAESEAASDLLEFCGGFPIALCVCGARLTTNEHLAIERLVGDLGTSRDAFEGLDRLLDHTFRDLAPDTAMMYRRLSLVPKQITAPVAAAAGDVAVDRAVELLGDLRAVSLIEQSSPERYRFHTLVARHAARCSERDEDPATRGAAASRVVDWYCAASQAADRAVRLDRLRLADALDAPTIDIPTFAKPGDAFSWFAIERGNVLEAVRLAFEFELYERVWQFAEAMWPLCAAQKHFVEWIASHELGVRAALARRDLRAEARIRSQLARAFADQGKETRARQEIQGARSAVELTDHVALRASVIEFEGVCELRLGSAETALACFDEARSGFLAAGDPRGVALQDRYAGTALTNLEQFDEAIQTLESARQRFLGLDDELNVGRVLTALGEARMRMRDVDAAREQFIEGIEVLDRIGVQYEQARAYEFLAEMADEQSEPETARHHRQEAHRIYVALEHPRAEELRADLVSMSTTSSGVTAP